jgi:DNA-binding winged helix-turn-helix (wHTH) protein/Tfp pilus assembly protein PilF
VRARECYRFGDFTLDVTERRLSRGSAPVHLAPKAHDVLVELVRDAGHLVTKHDLLARIWPEAFVEEGILTVHISGLRKALGEANGATTYIETVPRAGYRFVADVTKAPAGDRDAAAEPPHPLEASELVGHGRTHLLTASYFELPKAVSAFQRAIAIDPTYAAAHAGLALARCAQASLRAMPHLEAYADAKASALRALAMDDTSADAQVALGEVLFVSEWDWHAAERSFRRALDLSPHHIEALLHYGALLEALGDLDRGLRLKQQALERDPCSAYVLTQIAGAFWNRRRYDDVIDWTTKALERNPRHLFARELLAGAHFMKNDFAAFADENIRQAQAFGAPAETLAAVRQSCDAIARAHERGGRAAVIRFMLEQMPSTASPAASLRLATLYGELGDMDLAFDHLDRALDSRDPALVHLAVAPQWDGLRSDSRFHERLVRMHLA